MAKKESDQPKYSTQTEAPQGPGGWSQFEQWAGEDYFGTKTPPKKSVPLSTSPLMKPARAKPKRSR